METATGTFVVFYLLLELVGGGPVLLSVDENCSLVFILIVVPT